MWVILLSEKIDVYSAFMKFIAMVQRQFHSEIKCVRSDNGT